MSLTVAEVEEALLALSRRDRAAVIQRGLQTLDADADDASQEEIDAAWRDELSRRIDDIENGRVQMLNHEEVFTRARDAIVALGQ
ncbi:MAG: addiction module protein [Acidipropionibacterium sp.]|jgi:putative addiction module component (TIGR02574 family)|nr:addiction module protein [Acidipropionibacterium sp.]